MKTNILTLIITLVVGVIFAGALIAPVISDAQKTIGPEVEYTNAGHGYALISSNSDITATLTDTSITIGENEYTSDGSTYWMIASDTFAIWYGGGVNHPILITDRTNEGELYQPWIDTASITMSNGTYEITYTPVGEGAIEETYTNTYTWIMVPSENGEYISVDAGSTNYIKSLNDLIFSGYYSTGENDTYYSLKNGTAKAGEYTASVSGTLTLVEGTTDVYTVTNPLMHVGDEEFTPFMYLVKQNVTGHAASGASYSLLGAIPIMVIVALVMVAVGAIAYRRAD